jgi:hypothetical protein
MAKRGKTPSLIGGGAGACKFATAKHKRTCKRCKGAIPGGCDCIEVKVPSTMGCKCYCIDCFKEVLDQTQHDLDNLVTQVSAL